MKFFPGYGASESDVQRGFIDSGVQNKPEYDLNNYELRGSLTAVSDIDENNDFATPPDYEFRKIGLRAKGFLTRPVYGTDR